jgi:decaprenylphospho-beta-D-erythro-pentofuranosid-2-ulose 2-reductase
LSRILILGATSAVATQIARRYALAGNHLHLVGRNPQKLAVVQHLCIAATVTTEVADFDDLAENKRVIARAIDALGVVDIAVIAHGDLGNQQDSESSFADAELTLRTNFLSVVALIIPLSQHFELRRAGRLCIIGSVAGDRGRPRNYTYGAAKGALSIYLQGLRTRLRPFGVEVTTIKLGPVDSPMTRDHAKNMLFAKPERVARDIVRAIERGATEVYVPAVWSAIMPIVRGMPESLIQRLKFLSGR